MADLATRFWAKVKKTETCWLWQAAKSSNGYGRFYVAEHDFRQAHRVALELSGILIPDGKVADHKCRVRNCVNPAHLRVVTQRQNSLENSNGATARNAAKTHCPKGHPLCGDNLLQPVPSRVYRKCKTCKKEQRKHGQENRI